jgi:hypothetical protein
MYQAYVLRNNQKDFTIEFDQDEAERLEEIGYRALLHYPELDHVVFPFEVVEVDDPETYPLGPTAHLSHVELHVYRDAEYKVCGRLVASEISFWETELIARRQGTFPYAPKYKS